MKYNLTILYRSKMNLISFSHGLNRKKTERTDRKQTERTGGDKNNKKNNNNYDYDKK